MPAFYYSIGARYYKCERFTITMEVSCMKTQRRTADEQYQLIMECRSSGLSDYQWCTEHNINPGTFYNWVKRLRKKACYDILQFTMPSSLHSVLERPFSEANGRPFLVKRSPLIVC